MLLSVLMLVSIILSILFARARSKYMIVVGQEIIYDIRKDLFEHLQKLSFQFYDDRPHGKILTRVINYVNSVSDALSNGIINFVLEIFQPDPHCNLHVRLRRQTGADRDGGRACSWCWCC